MTKVIAFALVVIAINLTVSNLAALLAPPANAPDSLRMRLERNTSYEQCHDGFKCGLPVYVVNLPTR